MKIGLKPRTIFITLALVAATAFQAVAQSIEVKGVVIDASTEEPLIGATVRVKDVDLADVTNIDVNSPLRM